MRAAVRNREWPWAKVSEWIWPGPSGHGTFATVTIRSASVHARWVRMTHWVAAASVLAGVIAGHFRRHFLGGREALSVAALWRDLREHLRGFVPVPTGGPDYGPLQRISYVVVVFLVAPLLVLTGLTMSPAVVAATPVLLDLFGGHRVGRARCTSLPSPC